MKEVEVAAGVIFNPARTHVLLALRKPEQHQGDRWEFPGGKIEAGEGLADALARELLEEVGIVVTEANPRTIIEHSYPDKRVRLHFWDVTSFEGTPSGKEGQQLQWLELTKLGELKFPDANQTIVDTLIAG